MQPVYVAKSNNPASLVVTHKILLLFEIFKRKNNKKRNSRKKTAYAYAFRDWRETLRWVNLKKVAQRQQLSAKTNFCHIILWPCKQISILTTFLCSS